MNKPNSSGNSEVLLGRITSVFGIKGWVKVYSYTEPMENLLEYPEWILWHQGKSFSVTRTGGRKQGKGLVAKIKGYDTPEEAKLLAGAEIRLPEEALPPLPEGEYYWNQLIGLQVYNSEGQLYGKVNHLLETGANDVLIVKPCKGSLDSQERLIPWLLPEVVKQVDLESGVLQVDWDADF
ncbi:ribosome maturation factor RimM [Marinospirillum perlucidum]|uniref:ribosome maturation factor RimM n=1 Tax=Marinospirillum perlucidum TaxID=1982602 RepID=UPI000DF2FACD|nr:ribosome maturation factor RimM [Marinospirillum perlucidum]